MNLNELLHYFHVVLVRKREKNFRKVFFDFQLKFQQTKKLKNEIELFLAKKQQTNIVPVEKSQTNDLDDYSFADDIEVASSNHQETPNNHSVATTNLSAYSTPTLLQKLHDKTQILDEYYKDLSINKPVARSTQSLMTTTRSYCQRRQSNDNKNSRKSSRQFSENIISSQNSRYNLYRDEDQIFKELVRFNNDMDLILTRFDISNDDNRSIEQSPTTIITTQS